MNDDPNVLAREEVHEEYRTLHSTPGYIRLLCFTVFTFLRDPHQLHRFSSFLWEMEEILHKRGTNIYLCLRSKLGSDEIASKMFDDMDQPIWFKKNVYFASKYLKILPPVLLKILVPISRAFLLTWDVVKDVTLWVFLYNRI